VTTERSDACRQTQRTPSTSVSRVLPNCIPAGPRRHAHPRARRTTTVWHGNPPADREPSKHTVGWFDRCDKGLIRDCFGTSSRPRPSRPGRIPGRLPGKVEAPTIARNNALRAFESGNDAHRRRSADRPELDHPPPGGTSATAREGACGTGRFAEGPCPDGRPLVRHRRPTNRTTAVTLSTRTYSRMTEPGGRSHLGHRDSCPITLLSNNIRVPVRVPVSDGTVPDCGTSQHECDSPCVPDHFVLTCGMSARHIPGAGR